MFIYLIISLCRDFTQLRDPIKIEVKSDSVILSIVGIRNLYIKESSKYKWNNIIKLSFKWRWTTKLGNFNIKKDRIIYIKDESDKGIYLFRTFRIRN